MDNIRNIIPQDYNIIKIHLNEWWDGRQISHLLPKLFFDHFSNTSFIIEEGQIVTGFIIGFLSQDHPHKAYVHFVGVNPTSRKNGIGKSLYQHFFNIVQRQGIKEVECITSPANKTSICFHQKIGFSIKNGDKTNEEGVSFFLDYDGQGDDRVLFNIKLNA